MNPIYHDIDDNTNTDRRSGFVRRQTAPPPFSGTERRRKKDRRSDAGMQLMSNNGNVVKHGGEFIARAIRFFTGKHGRNGNKIPPDVSGGIHRATRLIDRVHDRINFEAPITIQDSDTYDIYSGTLFNHSPAGMYVETETAPRVHSGVVIHMRNYAADAAAPENIRKYYGQVRWCKKLSGMVVFVHHGIGIKLCSDLDEFIKTFGL